MYVKPRDVRLHRGLSIQEFLAAFTIYRNVICETSNRGNEFDLYLQDIIDIASKYKGNVFYQYHKSFAMKVATIKLTRCLAVDWYIRNEKLYATVCGGYPIHVCAHCGSGLHVSNMCSKYVESELRSNYVNNVQRVMNTLLVLTLTKVKASTQLIHIKDLN